MNDDELSELRKKFDLEPSYRWDSSACITGQNPDYLSIAYKMIRVPRKTLQEESITEAIARGSEAFIALFKKWKNRRVYYDFHSASMTELIEINNMIVEISAPKLSRFQKIAGLSFYDSEVWEDIANKYQAWPPDDEEEQNEDFYSQDEYWEFIEARVKQEKWSIGILTTGTALFLIQSYLERMLKKACDLLVEEGLSSSFEPEASPKSSVDQMLDHISSATDLDLSDKNLKRFLFLIRSSRNTFVHGTWESGPLKMQDMTLSKAIEACIDLTFKTATAILHEAVAQSR